MDAAVPDLDLDDELLPPDSPADAGTDIAAGTGAAEHRLAVPEALAGDRLDRVMAELLAGAGLSRSRLKALIEAGRVTVGGATIVDASHRVKGGEDLHLSVPAAVDAVPQPQAIPLTIVYEDADLLVVDKPQELVVHPAAGNPDGTLVNALLAHCGTNLSGIGGVRRPGIVHRLDKGTSGLMVVAKTDRAHHGLTAQFADRSLSRTYRALVWGRPSPAAGEVDANIGRHPTDRKRMAVLRGGGKPAVTRYRVVDGYGLAASLVECKLLTGRTHQIRVHMAHLGHPVLGDALYGKATPSRLKALPELARDRLAALGHQALHAAEISFLHPVTGARHTFAAELPNDMRTLIQSLSLI